jgi:hypothetical protein
MKKKEVVLSSLPVGGKFNLIENVGMHDDVEFEVLKQKSTLAFVKQPSGIKTYYDSSLVVLVKN